MFRRFKWPIIGGCAGAAAAIVVLAAAALVANVTGGGGAKESSPPPAVLATVDQVVTVCHAQVIMTWQAGWHQPESMPRLALDTVNTNATWNACDSKAGLEIVWNPVAEELTVSLLPPP